MTDFKPMKASVCESFDDVKFPVLVSPKLDGIRCVIVDGEARSNSLKLIQNKFIQETLNTLHVDSCGELNGLDGELMLQNPKASFQEITGAVMRQTGEPEFVFYVFDDFTNPDLSFLQRDTHTATKIREHFSGSKYVKHLKHELVSNQVELERLYREYLDLGYEGAMIRSLEGGYKFGRSSAKQGWLLKLKPFEDAEAEIVGFEERVENTNEAYTNELGRTARSSAKAGLVPQGTLGAFLLRRPDGVEFSCGSGLNDQLRDEYWSKKEQILGQIVKYKFQKIGSDVKPRLPIFLGIRHVDDLSR